VLLLGACGSGSGRPVAAATSTGARGTSPIGSGGASSAGGSTISQALAYARCMRSHGLARFPDPGSDGVIPKDQVVTVRKGNPSMYTSADRACQHLLPNGGNAATPAQTAQDWNQLLQFARCMRSHRVRNFPDPTDRSATDHRPMFNLHAAGLEPNSPQLKAKAQQCATRLHFGRLPPAQ